jgi:hypothetical protein
VASETFSVAVATSKGNGAGVLIQCPKRVLDPSEARAFAQLILHTASRAEGSNATKPEESSK